MTLRELNALTDNGDRDAFVAAIGWVFEDSPWVAQRAWDARPFASMEALHQEMVRQVQSATRDEQLALLRAHPDLGTRARMSAASTNEQAGARLDQLTPQECDELQKYRNKFGFPFLFAVKGSSKGDIMEALRRRVAADVEAEVAEALAQVYQIAWFRLEDTK
jgi:2-oxo-4-hydroxy-4-carboxy-5-ureidoimidazoline decarboxylase